MVESPHGPFLPDGKGADIQEGGDPPVLLRPAIPPPRRGGEVEDETQSGGSRSLCSSLILFRVLLVCVHFVCFHVIWCFGCRLLYYCDILLVRDAYTFPSTSCFFFLFYGFWLFCIFAFCVFFITPSLFARHSFLFFCCPCVRLFPLTFTLL